MKYLGIDYGKKRIGLAASDNGILARPIAPIQNKGDRKNIAAISQLKPDIIVLGVPLSKDDMETDMSREIRRFGAVLAAELGVNVVYHNERYSSLEAQQLINTTKLRETLDSVAAAVILQSWINTK